MSKQIADYQRHYDPPLLCGFELIEILREKGCRIPIIVLSTLESEASVDLALKLGAAAYISKPFKPKEPLKELKSIVPKPPRIALPNHEFGSWPTAPPA